MKALERALKIHRPHELEYRNELIKIQREINFLLEFMWEHDYQRFFAPMVQELTEKETKIKKALCKKTLPPMPDELRNPFTRPRTPEETEYIKNLVRDDGKRAKSIVSVE
jgi:hypothetical protein